MLSLVLVCTHSPLFTFSCFLPAHVSLVSNSHFKWCTVLLPHSWPWSTLRCKTCTTVSSHSTVCCKQYTVFAKWLSRNAQFFILFRSVPRSFPALLAKAVKNLELQRYTWYRQMSGTMVFPNYVSVGRCLWLSITAITRWGPFPVTVPKLRILNTMWVQWLNFCQLELRGMSVQHAFAQILCHRGWTAQHNHN